MNPHARSGRRRMRTWREQRNDVVIADFHDFWRAAPGAVIAIHYGYLRTQVLTKGLGISFGLGNWSFRVRSNLLKMYVPLGLKLGNSILKSICLGMEAIGLSAKAIRFTR